MRLSRIVLIVALAAATIASAARTLVADAPALTAPATTRPLSKTVGIDIIKKTTNPDGSLTLVFQWKDKDGAMQSRSVIVNSDTVIGIDGQLKTLGDVTDDVIRKKGVATVGPDMVTAVSLRFGRAMIAVTKDQLTAGQIASLQAAAPPISPASDEAVSRRVDGIVSSLNLNDPAKEARLKDILTTDLKAVRDSHNAGFAPEKSVRANLNAGLAADLTPEQVESVKDKLTVNKVPVTFRVYHEIVPNLTPEDDAKILGLLKQAREECLDVKNPDEMGRVFEPYKKQIEQYLISQGHDWHKLYKTFVDSQKSNGESAATQPG
jgi:hypothetical protein